MQRRATGREQRRTLVLILRESFQPSGIRVTDQTPKGLCQH
jgi:hypothetical protein